MDSSGTVSIAGLLLLAATDPADRYQSVPEFQQAIRGSLSHEEGIELAARATERLEAARKNDDYDEFSRARFGYETALEEWPENVRNQALEWAELFWKNCVTPVQTKAKSAE